MSLRAARRWWTARAMYAARAAAAHMPLSMIDFHEWLLATFGPRLPVLAKLVANNMRAAGVYRDQAFKDHFTQLARHLLNAMRVFRLASRPGAVVELARKHIDLDESIDHLKQALAEGKGAVVAPPHVCDYLLTLTRLNAEIPIWVYLRWSEDQRKLEAKRTWCEAAGLPVILEPPDAADPASRAAACVEVLQEGRALVMTPDIAQKAGKGSPVHILNHTASLPTGPASIAMLAEAPLVPVFGRLHDGKHIIYAEEPIYVESLSRAEGGRKESLRRAMQTWANHFETFMKHSPEAWYLWADNRWTRVWQNDPKYAGGGNTLNEHTPSQAETS